MRRGAVVLLCVLGVGCEPTVRGPSGPSRMDTDVRGDDTDADTDTDTDLDSDTDVDSDPDTDSPDPGCPAGMVRVEAFCIDRFEAALEVRRGGAWGPHSPYLTVDGLEVRAVSRSAVVPQAYISGDEAASACRASNKRLCTSTEWLRACRGSRGSTYPYGDAYRSGACNDTYAGGHPVVDFYGTSEGVWDATAMNNPGINQQDGTVARTGEYPACRSEAGAYDLHGNLHEWVEDAGGVFRGGFYADARVNGTGCAYRTSAHARSYHHYSTGFRCCADAR